MRGRIVLAIAAGTALACGAPSGPDMGGWATQEEVNESTLTTDFHAWTEATDTYTDWLGQEHRPKLRIECVNGRGRVVVDVGAAFDVEAGNLGHARMYWRGTTGQDFDINGKLSSNGHALFLDDAKALAHDAADSTEVLVEWSSFKHSKARAHFRTEQAAEHVARIDERCSW